MNNESQSLDELFPLESRVLLTGTGKQFVERIGIETVRDVILKVFMGENIRAQTEPLTRQRLTQLSGALIALFAKGFMENPRFANELSHLALAQLKNPSIRDKPSKWIAQWMIGLTGKSVQNVLRGRSLEQYIADFEEAISLAAARCHSDIGDLRMILGYSEDSEGKHVELDWHDITRLTTAIGSLTLTIRGSDKSMFGKLFERLILGAFLAILDFDRVEPSTNVRTNNIFWLSDSSDERESDATLLLRPGKLARFDIGFIGKGNSEISKDKLSRYAREFEISGEIHSSVTFIIVDRLPQTSKTQTAAHDIGAEIVQMSMQYWPRELARRLGERLGVQHDLQNIQDEQIEDYLREKLEKIHIEDFLSPILVTELDGGDGEK